MVLHNDDNDNDNDRHYRQTLLFDNFSKRIHVLQQVRTRCRLILEFNQSELGVVCGRLRYNTIGPD